MRDPQPREVGPFRIGRHLLALVGIWTIFVGATLAWNLYHQDRETLKMAENYARSSFEKDLVYRRWAAMHGRVYVEATEQTPPSPYLAHV